MSGENTLRVMLGLILLIALPIAVRHRLRSHTGEPLDRWQEGAFVLFGLRLSAILPFVACVTWMINPGWMTWSAIPIPSWIRWLGVVLSAGSAWLIAWTFHHLGNNLTDTVVTRRNHELVTSGPYQFVRHPFYVAGAIGLAGVSLAMANWFILLTGLVPAAFLIARTSREESKLVERFGGRYQDYQSRVGRFVPRLRR